MALPPPIDTNGEWGETCSRLYSHFEAIFKSNPRRMIRGKPLVFDKRILEGEYEEGFWHVITVGKGEDRLFDPERARRLSWLAAMLDRTAPNLTCWEYKEGDGSTKLYYWLEQDRYVLILSEKPKIVALVTAFYIAKPWLEKDLDKRRKAGNAF
jgi:hypothetical protein